VHLRESTVTDPVAHRLLSDYFAYRQATFPGGPDAYHVAFPTADAFTPPDGVFLVVVDDAGEGAGCGAIRKIQPAEDGTQRFEVKHVWLDPSSRGSGWATELLRELERRAWEFGGARLVLDTNDSLDAAARLYSRLNYERVAPYNDNPNATAWYAKDRPASL
jgi:ribosomal protein S18 acetylase RimI-like enzyme